MGSLKIKIWLLLAVLTICGAVCVVTCFPDKDKDNPSAKPTIERIIERDTILIGTTGDYRPLSFREADGTYWGFCIEVAGEIARRMGGSIRFVPTSWPTLSEDVQAEPQKFDLTIGGITITDARRETMLMSDGYLVNGKTILDWISETAQRMNIRDKALVEKTIRAFSLLEALARSGCPFLFKGGSSLMLHLNTSKRLSIDIDIICPPGTIIENYLSLYAEDLL